MVKWMNGTYRYMGGPYNFLSPRGDSSFSQHSCNVVLSCRKIWDEVGTIPITRILVRRRRHMFRSAYGRHLGFPPVSLGVLVEGAKPTKLTVGDLRSGRGASSSSGESWSVAEAIGVCISASTCMVLVGLAVFFAPLPVRGVFFVRAIAVMASFSFGESPCHVIRPRQKTCPSTVLSTSACVVDLAD